MISPPIKTNVKAFLLSQIFLRQHCVTDYPIDIKFLIENLGILLVTLKEYHEYRKIVEPDTSRSNLLEIRDGRAIYDSNHRKYIIVYNDVRPYTSYARIRFTLAHELGHIVLGHLDDERTELNRGGISNSLYVKFENEADTFAGNLLAPPIIINAKSKDSHFDSYRVRKAFGLSASAVETFRKADYLYWTTIPTTRTEKIVLHNFLNRQYPKYCRNCNMQIFGSAYKFCPICGRDLQACKGDNIMIYDGIEVNDTGKAMICPTCENEETQLEGEYCHICGTLLYNACSESSCRAEGNVALPGNARFCPFCGSKTTFFSSGFLKEWNASKPEDFEDDAETFEPPF